MKEVKEFILSFFKKEAEAWTKSGLGDLSAFNRTVEELHYMAIEELEGAFGIIKKDELIKEESPVNLAPRHLFKLTAYENKIYGKIWIAYASVKNPDSDKTGRLSEGFLITRIGKDLKITGKMLVELDKRHLYLQPTHWVSSGFNPSDIDILNLGKFIATERYMEPEDDGFSLENYLEDEMTVYPLLKEEFYDVDGVVSVKMKAEDNKKNRKVIENLIKKGVECKVEWIESEVDMYY